MAAGAVPFAKCDSPKCAENDDARHVKRPTGELVGSHLCFAHGVEEKLHVPGDACQRAEKVICKHARAHSFFGCTGLCKCHNAVPPPGYFDKSIASICMGRNLRLEIFMSGLVPDIQRDTTHKISSEDAK